MNKGLVFYYLFILTGAVFAVAIGLYIAKRNGLHKRAALIFVFTGLITGMFGAMLMARIQVLVMALAGITIAPSNLRIFGGLLFTPVFLIFPVKRFAGDYDTVVDGMTPGLFLLLGFAKLGCASNGCCFGIPFSPGVYSAHLDTETFPVQLLEAVLCFILSVAMFFFVINKKHRKGTAYPWALILYGVVRFFAEFLRYCPENERTLFLGVNFWQMFSVISVITGIIWLICKHRGKSRGSKISELPCAE